MERPWLHRLLGAPPLRPPGAVAEPRFQALCLRCGRCLAACPHDALRPAGLLHGLGAGTPLVEPRRAPCLLCLLCPPVCPSGALAPVARARDVRMGRARVVVERCYAHRGILCRTCVDECPLEGEAISVDELLRPVVTERCVGCGICQARCPVPEPAIEVVPAGAAP